MKPKTKHKAISHRITALFLALLFTATTLSPTITAIAADTTQTNSSGGTSAGAGDKLPTDVDENGEKTITISQDIYHMSDDGKFDPRWEYKFTIKGSGKFVMIGYYNSAESHASAKFQSYILSDKNFSGEYDLTLTNNGFTSLDTYALNVGNYQGVYYSALGGLWSSYENSEIYTSGFVNERQTDYKKFEDALKADIDNGNIDLSKDDYISPDDIHSDSYEYDKSLGYLQGVKYYEVKSLGNERDAIISWNASNPELNDCQIEIRANNFYTEWWNKKTSEICTYTKYGSGVFYKDGKYTFKTLDPCRSWLSQRNFDAFSASTQSYGTTEYYVRLLRYDKNSGKVKCGGWVKIDINRGTSSQLPDSTSDTGGFDDDTGDWKDDDDSDDSYHDHVGDDGEILPIPDMDFDGILDAIYSLFDLIGSFPSLLGQVFSFLPSWLISSVSVSIALILIIAIYKMIRG